MKQGYAASGVRLSAEAEKGMADLFFFLTRYWKLDLQELPHREMCAVVESSELESETPFSMLVVPRDCWKCQDAEEFDEMSGRLPLAMDGQRVVVTEQAIERGETAPVFRVKTSSGRSLDVTGNHPFMTWSGWKSHDEGLAVGEWIAVLRRGLFGEIHEPALAKLVGWMLADAHLPAQTVTAFAKEERAELIALAAECGYEAVEAAGQNVRIHGMQAKWREWGLFQARSAQKFTPDFVLQGDKETVAAYLRGLFHDAGLGHGNGRVVYTTTSRRLARDVMHLLVKFGLRPNLTELENLDGRLSNVPDGYLWFYVSYTDTEGIFCKAELDRPSVTDRFPPEWRSRIQPRRANELREAGIRVDNVHATTRDKVRKAAAFFDDKELLDLCDSDIAWEPIKSISPLGEREIVAAETPTHTLAAGDIISHNTSILRGAAVWKQLRQIHLHDNPYHRIAIMSSTLALGRAALRVIEGQLRYNRDLIAAYGELWTMGSKTEDGIVLAPRIERGEKASIADPSFWIGSERAGQVGRHADEALVDDINNNDNSATIHRREKVHTLWALLFPLIGSHGGRRGKIMMACTPWHDDDVRGRILRTEREREAADADYKSPWRMIHRSILNEDGTSFFPSRYPVERIEKMREDMPVREFAANYLADPIGDAMFVNPTAIVFKPRAEFPTLRDIRIAVDPHQHGDAKKLGCYAAMVAVGYDRFANMYVMDARGSRSWGSSQFIDALFLMGEEYEGIPIYIEDSHMAHFDTAVRLEEAQRSEKEGRRVHLRISYVPVDVKVTYYQRWERVQHRFQRGGAVVFAQEIDPKLKAEIKEELIRGGAARFNDFLDALAIADTGIRPRVAKDGSLIPVAEKKMPSKPGSMTFADAFPGYRGVM